MIKVSFWRWTWFSKEGDKDKEPTTLAQEVYVETAEEGSGGFSGGNLISLVFLML